MSAELQNPSSLAHIQIAIKDIARKTICVCITRKRTKRAPLPDMAASLFMQIKDANLKNRLEFIVTLRVLSCCVEILNTSHICIERFFFFLIWSLA